MGDRVPSAGRIKKLTIIKDLAKGFMKLDNLYSFKFNCPWPIISCKLSF
jgi:hypothetical protein